MSQETRFHTAADAVEWLKQQGWKISSAQFSRHFKAGHIPKDDDGNFTAPALLGYASARLQPEARIDDQQSRRVALGKMSADSELKTVRAARERLRLEKEQGKLMPVEQHEADLAARAVFFRSELTSFIHRTAAEIIDTVDGEPDRVPELIQWWERETADLMDGWSVDREFVVMDGAEDLADDVHD